MRKFLVCNFAYNIQILRCLKQSYSPHLNGHSPHVANGLDSTDLKLNFSILQIFSFALGRLGYHQVMGYFTQYIAERSLALV